MRHFIRKYGMLLRGTYRRNGEIVGGSRNNSQINFRRKFEEISAETSGKITRLLRFFLTQIQFNQCIFAVSEESVYLCNL